MASLVIALGVTIYFSVKKVQTHKERKRALRNEDFLSNDVTEKMAVSGASITDHGYDYEHAEDHLTPHL
ncbi:hypothetical protein N0V91_001685 [Didymella pomorum]|uniref:Uncharacterized protein n=1 Tax=Didymella pomorum TaxID=749634 RepID=A0A9W8ZNK8_9PLEO|nr:hypothetical protein N0V91_001685 [Didymella pomorum]